MQITYDLYDVVTECKGLMYGKDCNISCGHCLASEQCHHINGTCMNGCDNGYQGINCTQGKQLRVIIRITNN